MREHNEKCFGKWKLSDSSAYLEVQTHLYLVIAANVHVNFPLWEREKKKRTFPILTAYTEYERYFPIILY